MPLTLAIGDLPIPIRNERNVKVRTTASLLGSYVEKMSGSRNPPSDSDSNGEPWMDETELDPIQ